MLRTGTTYCRKTFIGIPNISRCKNRPNMFMTTASTRTANRSSNSRNRNVTLVARFLGTGEIVSGIVLFLRSAFAIQNQQGPDGAYDGCPVVKRDAED